MTLDNGIFVEFLSQGAELVYPADWVSFAISDSIHSLYSKMNLNINDKEGKIAELLLSNVGNVIEIKYGYEERPDVTVGGSFVVNQDMMGQTGEDSSIFSGPLDIYFFHEWFNQQSNISRSFQDSISNIVRRISREYNFNRVNIDRSGNFGFWYQPLISSAKFLTEILVPRSFSTQSDNTPFFCFIDVHGEFNFLSYKSMFSEDIFNYTYWPKSVGEDSKIDNFILSISRWSDTLQNIKKSINTTSYQIDNDGVFSKKMLNNEEFLTKSLLESYPVSNQIGNSLNYSLDFYDYEGDEDQKAKEVQLLKQSLFRDQFLLLVPFNPSIKAGKTINMDLVLPTESNDTFSSRFSGKYLVESTEHVWDGESKASVSKLVVSRKYSKIPNEYSLKELF